MVKDYFPSSWLIFNFVWYPNENDSFGKFIVFVIKDISTNKEYKYIGNRIKLQNPITINKNGKEITYRYKNIIGKYKPELDLI